MLLVVLPILPAYLLSQPRISSSALLQTLPGLRPLFSNAPHIMAVAYSINLALFYLQGKYHTLTQRLLRTSYISTVPPNPDVRPPSYALLGVLVLIRIAYKGYRELSRVIQESRQKPQLSEKALGKLRDERERVQVFQPSVKEEGFYLDFIPVADILTRNQEEEDLDVGESSSVPRSLTLLHVPSRSNIKRQAHLSQRSFSLRRSEKLKEMYALPRRAHGPHGNRMRAHFLLDLYIWMGQRKTGMPSLPTRLGREDLDTSL